MIGIIGGSGLYHLPALQAARQVVSGTPYGDPSGPLQQGVWNGAPVLFLARHGPGHRIAPHAINYRANIHALRAAGAALVVAVNAVGGIDDDCEPGALLLPQQLIDYTWGRAHSFFDGAAGVQADGVDEVNRAAEAPPLRHVDFTMPYDAALRTVLLRAARAEGIAVRDGGVYAATQGPRFESAAEIRRLERDGATMVGMTGMPEAGLAREAGLAYAALCVVVNRAAGKSGERVAMEQIGVCLEQGIAGATRLLQAAAPLLQALSEERRAAPRHRE